MQEDLVKRTSLVCRTTRLGGHVSCAGGLGLADTSYVQEDLVQEADESHVQEDFVQ